MWNRIQPRSLFVPWLLKTNAHIPNIDVTLYTALFTSGPMLPTCLKGPAFSDVCVCLCPNCLSFSVFRVSLEKRATDRTLWTSGQPRLWSKPSPCWSNRLSHTSTLVWLPSSPIEHRLVNFAVNPACKLIVWYQWWENMWKNTIAYWYFVNDDHNLTPACSSLYS